VVTQTLGYPMPTTDRPKLWKVVIAGQTSESTGAEDGSESESEAEAEADAEAEEVDLTAGGESQASRGEEQPQVARGGEVIRTQPPLPIVYVESHCDNIRVISLRYITDIILISLWSSSRICIAEPWPPAAPAIERSASPVVDSLENY
jgi:hypothetical protein